MRQHIRVYRALLLLFPRRFRRQCGSQMERLFDAMWRERREAARFGGTSWLTFWLLAVRDVTREATHARFEASERSLYPSNPLPAARLSMDKLGADLRYAFGSLRRSPGFAAIAILTLGLGIGATTAVFSVADAVVLRPLPYPDPHELVAVFEIDHETGEEQDTFAGANFVDWRASNTSFEELAAVRTLTRTITGQGYPRRINAVSVTANFFAVFGIDARLGRVLSMAEDPPGSEPVAVLSHAFWQAEFGSEADVLGDAITLNGTPYTIVGVMPPGFQYPPRREPTHVWTAAKGRVPDPPFDFGGDPAEDRGAGYLRGVARLAQSVSLDEAQAEMALIAERLAREHPEENSNEGINVMPLGEAISGDVRPLLFVLLAAVGLVLLIACSNVANLLLSKAARREQEFAMRKALGASHWRVARQLLTESIVLAGLGGLLGVIVSRYGTRALVALAPSNLPGAETATLDLRVLGFALVSVVGAAILFGMAPAVGLVGQDLQSAIREGAGGVGSVRRHRRLGKALIVAEVALSLLLVVGAGLMGRTFLTLTAVDPGFDPDDTLVAHVALPDSRYAEDHQVSAFFDQVVGTLRAHPGVESAGSVLTLPMGWNIRGTLRVSIDDRRVSDADDKPLAGVQLVTPGYFRTLRIPLLRGRLLSESDTDDAPSVALINETFAETYFPQDDPLGKRLTWNNPDNDEADWFTIVGIVADTHLEGLDAEAVPETYQTYSQSALGFTTFVVRSTMDPDELATIVREAVLEVDPEQPVSGISSMNDVLAASLGDRRFNMVLLGSFALAALLMAAIGLYGVLSFSVAQRTPEIGLRRALGAQRRGVVGLVVGEGVRLVVAGMLLGSGAAVLLGRFIASQVYGVSTTDPISFTVGALLVVAVALVACWVPAQRAAGTDPMVALRRG